MSAFRRAAAIGAFTAVLAAGAFGAASAANADPATPSTDTYSAVGSDTLQDLFNGYESGAHIASWNATIPGQSGDAALGGTVVLKNSLNANTAGTAIGRPNGSGDGRKALSAAWNTANHVFSQTVTKTSGSTTTNYTVPNQVIDFSRASGLPSAGLQVSTITGSNLVSVPLARDAVTVATNDSGAASALGSFVFTPDELSAIYGLGSHPTGVYTQSAGSVTVGDVQKLGSGASQIERLVTSTGTVNLKVILPQASSGTRQFFIAALGGGTPGLWVNANHEENTASEVINGGAGTIYPFSAGQYIYQYNHTSGAGTVHDAAFAINSVKLGVVIYTPAVISGGVAAPGTLYDNTSAKPTLAFARDIYTVVPTATMLSTNTSSYATGVRTLVETTLPGSSLLATYGFKQISYSNDPTKWTFSTWEN